MVRRALFQITRRVRLSSNALRSLVRGSHHVFYFPSNTHHANTMVVRPVTFRGQGGVTRCHTRFIRRLVTRLSNHGNATGVRAVPGPIRLPSTIIFNSHVGFRNLLVKTRIGYHGHFRVPR